MKYLRVAEGSPWACSIPQILRVACVVLRSNRQDRLVGQDPRV